MMRRVLLLVTVLLAAAGCTRHVAEVKAQAPRVWQEAGFAVVGYEGYQWDPFCGGDVWYLLRKIPDNGVTYHGYLCKWGGEFHIYNLQALDALKP